MAIETYNASRTGTLFHRTAHTVNTRPEDTAIARLSRTIFNSLTTFFSGVSERVSRTFTMTTAVSILVATAVAQQMGIIDSDSLDD